MKDNNYYFVQTENSKRDIWHFGKYSEEKKAVLGEFFMFHESFITKYMEIQMNAYKALVNRNEDKEEVNTYTEFEFKEIENPLYEKDSN